MQKRICVVVFEGGGKDGLNLAIPTDQQAAYQNSRPVLGIAERDQIPLENGYDLALHPKGAPIKELYERGKVNFVQQVIYENTDQSHFKSTEIVWGGGDGNGIPMRGSWAGRYLQDKYPNYPYGYPNEKMKHPPAICLGQAMPKIVLNSFGPVMGIKLQGAPDSLFYTSQIVEQPHGELDDISAARRSLLYLKGLDDQADAFALNLKEAYDRGQVQQDYPEGIIGPQMRQVAKCILGGADTELYVVSIGTFDTHAGQIYAADDNTNGSFAESLKDVYGSILAFQNEMEASGNAERVLVMTFSEFGRRVVENSAKGTDHGTAMPILLVGDGVTPGVTGKNADLSQLDADGDFLNYNYDYRRVLRTVLGEWLGAGPRQLAAAGLLGFDPLPLIHDPYPIELRDQTYDGSATSGEIPSEGGEQPGEGGENPGEGGEQPGEGGENPGEGGEQPGEGGENPGNAVAELTARIDDLEAQLAAQKEAAALANQNHQMAQQEIAKLAALNKGRLDKLKEI